MKTSVAILNQNIKDKEKLLKDVMKQSDDAIALHNQLEVQENALSLEIEGLLEDVKLLQQGNKDVTKRKNKKT